LIIENELATFIEETIHLLSNNANSSKMNKVQIDTQQMLILINFLKEKSIKEKKETDDQ
jgi:hypothetical protein